MRGSTVTVVLVWSHGLMIVPQRQQRFRLSRSPTCHCAATLPRPFSLRESCFLSCGNSCNLPCHADVLRGSSRVPAPRTSADTSGQIPFPLFPNISWSSRVYYWRTKALTSQTRRTSSVECDTWPRRFAADIACSRL